MEKLLPKTIGGYSKEMRDLFEKREFALEDLNLEKVEFLTKTIKSQLRKEKTQRETKHDFQRT